MGALDRAGRLHVPPALLCARRSWLRAPFVARREGRLGLKATWGELAFPLPDPPRELDLALVPVCLPTWSLSWPALVTAPTPTPLREVGR